MDIKEIALRIAEETDVKYPWNMNHGPWIVSFAEALIESYKAELLKEVGAPVLYAEFAEDGGWLGVASEYQDYLEEPHELYTSDQVAAAIIKATKPLEEVKEALGEYLCSADDSPSAVRRLVSAYQERNNSAAKYCSQLNEQDAELEQLRSQLVAAQEEIKTVTEQKNRMWFEMQSAQNQLATAEQRVAEACSRTVYVQADQIKKLTAERDAALARLSEERDIWDRMLGDAADKFAHLEREIDDCLYVLDALWDKQCNKIVTQKWAEILTRNKRVTGVSSAEDSSEPTSSE